ncbi:ABC-2 family transporter protein [Clavibacter michiganensis subsp. michiganensis]|uniref:YhgE/Pip family protein n=1 Tax=Clavibacter michiganensis TaxID=28447 RepID=UPI000B6FD87F|nr:YhgE/Pip domain-containing protein [Clavibacter michiganensis]OUD98919.1 ABC-2 family transporter protein [Clavibacter michiganensis subsp. michiganensis]
MRLIPLVRAELTRLTATTMSKVALVALVLVPVLYGGLYLWANQDPYSSLDKVPAALVVADQGATVDGKPVDYGTDVAKDVLDDASFDWHEVSSAEARTGLEDGTYDFTLTIPSGFSAALSSSSGTDPQQARVVMATDDANSYLATTIAQQAGARITKSVASRVGTEAAGKLLLGLADVRSSLGDAASGAQQLVDGTASARSGADDLAAGNGKLATGADTLSSGLGQLRTGTAQLPAQTKQLAKGADQVASGAATLSSGATELSTGAAALTPGAQQTAAGAREVADGNAQIAALGSPATASVDQLAGRVPALRTAIQDRMAKAGIPQADIDAALAKLDVLGTDITGAASGADGLNTQLQQLATGSEQVAQGSAQVAAGAAKLQTGSAALAQGAGTLASGSSQVATGADALAKASPALADGIAQAADGSATLATGAHSASDGATSLATGLGTLQDGTTKLRDGLDSGLDQIPASTEAQRGAQADTIGDPVALRQDAVTQAGEYGAGLAPFFISLAAWIGIYALFLIVKPLSRRAITARKAPLRITLAGWLTPALLGVVQMAGLYAIVAGALGFRIAHPLAMYGTMVLASITFAAIILALNVLLGSVGQFLGLVLMVVQLVTAGGTFPWQTLPGPLAALHHVLPMSFAVDALRQLMYGGDLGQAAQDAGVLALWLVAGLAVALAGAIRITSHRTLRDLRPSLIG